MRRNILLFWMGGRLHYITTEPYCCISVTMVPILSLHPHCYVATLHHGSHQVSWAFESSTAVDEPGWEDSFFSSTTHVQRQKNAASDSTSKPPVCYNNRYYIHAHRGWPSRKCLIAWWRCRSCLIMCQSSLMATAAAAATHSSTTMRLLPFVHRCRADGVLPHVCSTRRYVCTFYFTFWRSRKGKIMSNWKIFWGVWRQYFCFFIEQIAVLNGFV